MDIIEKRFANGMPVIVIPMPGARTVTAIYLVEAGWRYENSRVKGAAHFLEHMLFKGTRKWPTAQALSVEIEGAGGQANAFTQPEAITFFVKMPSREAPLASEILSDMILYPLLHPEAVESEKKPVLEELAMYETDPGGMLESLWLKTLFGNHPLGWTGLGTPKSLARISRETLLSYLKGMFVAQNSVLVFAGGIANPETFVKKIEKHWIPGLSSDSPLIQRVPFVETQTEPRAVIVPHKTEQMLVSLGVKFDTPDLPTRLALNTLNVALGVGMSSRLFLGIREKRGLAYAISSDIAFRSEVSFFEVEAGLNKDLWQEGVAAILFELERVAHNGISVAELSKVKRFIRGMMETTLESSLMLARLVASDWTAEQKATDIEEELRLLDDITPRQIQRAAQMIFRNERLNLVVVGASRKEEEEVRKIFRFSR